MKRLARFRSVAEVDRVKPTTHRPLSSDDGQILMWAA